LFRHRAASLGNTLFDGCWHRSRGWVEPSTRIENDTWLVPTTQPYRGRVGRAAGCR